MPALDITGAYVGVTSFKRATNITTPAHDEDILGHLVAASREIDRLTLRRFFPVTATNKYRWPPFHVAASWEIWTEDDLLSVSSIEVAVAGHGAVPVAITNYFLEPQTYGPPYNRVEVDLSSTDAFQSGPTPQQSVQITGQWGYCNTTVAIGTLTSDLASGDTTLASITGTTLAAVEPGDVLLIGTEAIYADYDLGSGNTVLRRGVNGTTAATHTAGTAVAKYRAPEPIRRIVRADAIGTYQQDLASWGRTIGALGMDLEWSGKMARTYRQTVVAEYMRRRSAAV